MSDCYTNSLMSLQDGLNRLLSTVKPVTDIELLALEKLDGRIIGKALVCPMNVPPADNSAMDGYGVRFADCAKGTPLNCIGQSMAGQPFEGNINAGECVRIMTGSIVPEGVDSVVMQEQVIRDGDTVTLQNSVKEGQNIRRAGEDLAADQLLFEIGHKITPADIGLLASLGIAQVTVYRKPRIALISNGDELIEPGAPLSKGQIYESNRYALAALLRRLPLDVDEFGIIPDQPDALREAFSKAANYDAVISSGGVSVGDADYIKVILDEMGQIDFWKLAIKPGKPFAFGTLGQAHYFGLPGNPVSAMVTCHQLAVPALRQLTGELVAAPLKLVATCTEAIRKRPGRMDFQRGIVERGDDGVLCVRTTGKQGSGIMSSLSHANCYLLLAQDRGAVAAGEQVEILLFDQLMG
ncbi:molybdopterin molybdotransferase MoeA [Neiella marina]|uniref:Molybdopterin molybdenumtransferase n=1 Tax=Neiella holothuriorum TaxID=2870530 RepID=A0ABS7EH45_9GAMM|nr:molybdopterin molybdotransferase MoeA [Neiella holothuriorum]MBW8191525.1 molybdopterin molybdotransferase MoeA [Neiella holothuriorum]